MRASWSSFHVQRTTVGGDTACRPGRGMVAKRVGSVKRARNQPPERESRRHESPSTVSFYGFRSMDFRAGATTVSPSGRGHPLTTALIGTSAALALCVVALGLVLPLRRRRVRAEARDLAAAVARAEEEARRGRFLGELAASIDLDEVLARTLEAATTLPGADAALLTLRGEGGKPIVAALGLDADEAERRAAAGFSDDEQARAVSVSFRYRDEDGGRNAIRGGLAVPVVYDESGALG